MADDTQSDDGQAEANMAAAKAEQETVEAAAAKLAAAHAEQEAADAKTAADKAEQEVAEASAASLAAAEQEALELAKAAAAEAEAARPLMVAMITRAPFANVLTNSGRTGGVVETGERIEVDPFYAQDLQLAGLADPVEPEQAAATLKKAGARPSPHGGGIKLPRSKA